MVAPIDLTAPDNSVTRIEASKVRRIRGAIGVERDDGCHTLVSNAIDNLVKELPDDVAGRVMAHVKAIIRFTQLDGTPVWFNGLAIEGPQRLTSSEIASGANSAVHLQGKMFRLKETGQQVYDAILAAGGTPLPVPAAESGMIGDLLVTGRNWLQGIVADR